MGIHKGTKLTELPKNNTLKFRYDDETAEQLEYLSKKNDVSKSEIVRRGIEIQYNSEKEQPPPTKAYSYSSSTNPQGLINLSYQILAEISRIFGGF